MTHTKGKTCDSCTHYLDRGLGHKVCTRGVTEREPIHGNRVFRIEHLCAERRDDGAECGPEGIHWESKWAFLKAWVGYAIIGAIAVSAAATIARSPVIQRAVTYIFP